MAKRKLKPKSPATSNSPVKKRKKQVPLFTVITFAILFAAIAGFTVYAVRELSYKQGQVDYANGTINYELFKRGNGETFWKRIK